MVWTVFFMKKSEKLKRWELALVLAVCLSFSHGLVLDGAAGCHWWGVIFPGLTDVQPAAADTEAAAFPALRTPEGRVLRLQLLDWLRGLGLFQ